MDPPRNDSQEPVTIPLRHRRKPAQDCAAPLPADPPAATAPQPGLTDPTPHTEPPAESTPLPLAGFTAVESLFLRAAMHSCGARTRPPTEGEAGVAVDNPAATPVPAPAGECPRCGTKLLHPDGLGLCRKCGYCRSLDHGRDTPPVAETGRAQSLLQMIEMRQRTVALPGWLFVLPGGMVAVLLSSLAVHHILPTGGFARAVWSSSQLGLGMIVLLIGQWWALLKVTHADAGLSAFDVFAISTRLWERAFRMMPATRWPVYLGIWGATAVVSAIAITGGLFYWIEPH